MILVFFDIFLNWQFLIGKLKRVLPKAFKEMAGHILWEIGGEVWDV